MYLKSLTLKGFKSFAAPTSFQFEPGITCVVGPNGSGKSNVVDALAWVMGEQGAKTLRGGKMEDVIFAGTATKGPLGRAEVTLTIDNTDGALPIEYSEVTISRTLFRNGGSEYAINAQQCRLLDVQELLSDSGLGREMHVIVGQGQLDAVLHANPEDRRGFIEEAAGILKHRRRKEKTLRKLDAMQANLTRLSDLAGEIRRQLKPLGQQAEIAKEAASIASIVRDARARLLADEVVGLRAAITAFSRSETERKTERIVLQEQLDQAKLRVGRLEQAQAGDAVDGARRLAFGLESVQERLRGLFTLANQRLALLGQQGEGPAVGSTVTGSAVQEAIDEADRLQAGVAQAEESLGGAAAALATAKASLDSLDEEIAAQSALVSRHDLELAALASRVEVAQSRLASARGQLLRQRTALEQAEQRRDATRAEFVALEATAATSVEADGSLDAAYEQAEARVTSINASIEGLRDELHAAERERDALAARSSALSLAVEQKDGSSALVGARLPGIRGLVAEHVRIRPGFEAAISAALGSLADAVLADDRDAAITALVHSARHDFGRVEVVIAAAPTADALTAPGVVAATEVVEAPDGVLGLLAHVLVADDLEAAREAFAAAPDGATFVTRAGDVLTAHVLRGGSGAKRSRLELVAERDAAASRLAEVTTAIERTRFALAEQRGLLETAKSDVSTALTALREYDAAVAAQSEQLGRLRIQLEAAQAEWERLSEAVEVSAEVSREAEADVTRAKSEHDEAATAPRPMLDASARDGMLAEVERARAAELELRIQLETIRERVRAERARAQQLAEQLAAERAAAQEQARLTVIRQRQIAAANRVVAALPAVLDSVDRSVSSARVELAARESERSAQNQELTALRREEGSLRERLSAIGENVHGLEMQIYEKKLQLSTLLERAGEELGLIEEVLVAEYGPEVPVPLDDPAAAHGLASPEFLRTSADGTAISSDASDSGGETPEKRTQTVRYDRAEQQARLTRAERKLAQLGRVNPLALEEFDALEQRHRFLTEQLTDLTHTRRDLLTIIDEIDTKMQDIFAAAFADTKAAFDRVFPILFPGGSGSLHLTDPDNMLTTGIEVTVKPAGKKIERLSLLSGGERSLAAVALLIAIFQARPSPFYILDEVEAALDDANLGRLLTILEDLRETSQLIVVTHQKRTMEIADALYGVSMRADGISAVVGQRVTADKAS